MLHKVDILVIKTYIFFKQISFRRDKEFCHECRFCCTLSICTVGDKQIFKETKNDTHQIKSEKSKAISAQSGFLVDLDMYNSNDYRCLKPKKRLRPSKWPHYYMPEFRAAKNKEELRKVEEVPFDKNFHNMEDPKVFKAMTDPKKGLKLWKKTYGMDFVDFLPVVNFTVVQGQTIYAPSFHRVYKNCLGAEYGKFALDCKKKGGFFKCCMTW